MLVKTLFLSVATSILLSLFTFTNLSYAEDILPGQYKTGSIAPGESDFYTFYANAGDSVTVLMGKISGAPGFYPRVELHGPDGNVIATSSGQYAATIDSKKVYLSGLYTIVARDNIGNQSGTYGLSMIKNPGTQANDPNDNSVPILPGQYKTGEILEGDLDAYTFYANAGDSITVLMGEIDAEPGFYPNVELHGPDGTVIETSWGQYSATITSATVNQSGTCYIIARDNIGSSSGTYGLSMIRNPGTEMNDPNDDSVPILPGQYKTGEILKGDLDTYTFYANAGDSVTVLMGEIDAEPGFYPNVELHGPDGTVIETSWGQYSATITSATVNQSGTCYIIARDNIGSSSGTYGLSMTRINVGGTPSIGSISDTPDPVLQGQVLTLTVSGVSDSGGSVVQVDFYRDLNRNGYLDLDGSDQLLGSDTSSSGGWLWQGEISGSPLAGVNRYFARAKDNQGFWSDYVTCTGVITPLFNGDFNNDNAIDWGDLVIFADNWLRGDCGGPDWCDGTDFDQTSIVDFRDFAIFVDFWL